MKRILSLLGLLLAIPAQAALISELPNTGASNSLLFEVHDTNRGTSASGHLTITDLAGYISTQGVWNLTLPPWNVSKANASDQTEAIQAALNAASNIYGKPVCYLPAAKYQIAGTLVLGFGAKLLGDSTPQSSRGTELTKTGTGPCIDVVSGGSVVIKGLFLNGGGASNDRTGIRIVRSAGNEANYWKLEDVRISEFNRGIDLYWTWDAEIISCYVNECGSGLVASNDVNTLTILGGGWNSNSNHLHHIGSPSTATVTSGWRVMSTFEGGGTAVVATNQYFVGNLFTGCYFEGLTNYAFKVKNAKKLTIDGCLFDNPGITNIYLETAYTPTVRDCIFLGGTQIPLYTDSATAGFIYDGNRHDYSAQQPLISSTSYTRNDGGSLVLNGQSISTGSGSPESVVTAPVGSIYLRSDGSTSTTLYVKTSGTGNTGWTAK